MQKETANTAVMTVLILQARAFKEGTDSYHKTRSTEDVAGVSSYTTEQGTQKRLVFLPNDLIEFVEVPIQVSFYSAERREPCKVTLSSTTR